jgi:hypothetical protein
MATQLPIGTGEVRDMANPQLENPKPIDSDPEPEEIARLAYHYWKQRGCPDGTPEEDWFRAEEEIERRRAAAVARTVSSAA